ncbi:hypothetical protein [Paraburkholderia sp. BL21I4N1]|uniref:hypothetical protein n=1 Tax=Paraburkholderia sp. BL21I4N1 TaxID=1938801 RepID=UPI000CFABD4A|nr:hypothetical protein [Paraburkholderia sp. BL21I4N1]PQV49785.1 hypothetical protein B0G83_10674 [Paraburkholderia sp. BL21I4N1]
MTIRTVCVFTLTALGVACSSPPFARTFALPPATVVYAPPPRPVHGGVPVNPVYVAAPPLTPVRVTPRIVATAPRAAADRRSMTKKAVESA